MYKLLAAQDFHVIALDYRGKITPGFAVLIAGYNISDLFILRWNVLRSELQDMASAWKFLEAPSSDELSLRYKCV